MNRGRSSSTLYRSNSLHGGASAYQTQSRLYDCFQQLSRLKERCWKECVAGEKVLAEQPVPRETPMQLPIHATFSWVEHDEDQLYGRTIVSMLRTLPLVERNRLKVHIFSLIASAQCEIEDKEYLV